MKIICPQFVVCNTYCCYAKPQHYSEGTGSRPKPYVLCQKDSLPYGSGPSAWYAPRILNKSQCAKEVAKGRIKHRDLIKMVVVDG